MSLYEMWGINYAIKRKDTKRRFRRGDEPASGQAIYSRYARTAHAARAWFQPSAHRQWFG